MEEFYKMILFGHMDAKYREELVEFLWKIAEGKIAITKIARPERKVALIFYKNLQV